MTVTNEPRPGQLSADGRSFWSNGAWVSSVSADGTSKWNGHAWVAQPRVFFQNQEDDTTDIDGRARAEGRTPPRVKDLPGPCLYKDRHVAVGTGWLATRFAPAGGWHVMRTRDIQSVAIVPPSTARQAMFWRSPTTPKPFVAIQDRLGNVMSLNVLKFKPSAGSALTAQLPRDTFVSTAARNFLRGGRLPGQWGKKFIWWKGLD